MTMLMTPEPSSRPDEQHAIARALCAALAFESFFKDHNNKRIVPTTPPAVKTYTLAKGRITPMLSSVDLEDEFFDAVEFHDSDPENELHLAFSRSSSVEMIRGSESTSIRSRDSDARASPALSEQLKPVPVFAMPPLSYDAPVPPKETPLRFIRAGKGDPVLGRQRYEQTLAWRQENRMNTILKEPEPHFELIKRYYPHHFHLKGKNGEYCYYESPPQTNLKALREGGVDLQALLRHYAMVTEFSWQYIDRNDFGQSIYIIDLKGIRVSDFVGECVDFVRKASQFTGAHYPERAGCVFVINVPSWFKCKSTNVYAMVATARETDECCAACSTLVIWNVVKPMVDVDTLKKIYILRGKKEIFNSLCERIPLENIPPEYGGNSMPLGQAPEERLLWDLMTHNNALANGGKCKGTHSGDPCPFCTFRYARSY